MLFEQLFVLLLKISTAASKNRLWPDSRRPLNFAERSLSLVYETRCKLPMNLYRYILKLSARPETGHF
jgi:hypothetical protein